MSPHRPVPARRASRRGLRAAVLDRADELYQDLQGNASRVTRAKLDFLEEVLSRDHPHLRDMAV